MSFSLTLYSYSASLSITKPSSFRYASQTKRRSYFFADSEYNCDNSTDNDCFQIESFDKANGR
jgi:hypothetical protein